MAKGRVEADTALRRFCWCRWLDLVLAFCWKEVIDESKTYSNSRLIGDSEAIYQCFL
jgi:hypothetical protein